VNAGGLHRETTGRHQATEEGHQLMRTSNAPARLFVSKGLPHHLDPIPLHDEITFLSLPRRRIVLTADRATFVASVHTQDECPELFGLRVGAEKDGLCGVSGKRLSPSVARTDVDRN
jgi:hypothetical protein